MITNCRFLHAQWVYLSAGAALLPCSIILLHQHLLSNHTLHNTECNFPSMKDLWIVKWFSSSFSLWNFMQLFPGEQKCYKVCNNMNNWIGNVLQTQEKWQSWQEPPQNLEINFKRFGDNYSTAQVCFVFCCSFICHLLLQIVNVYFRHWKFSLNLHTFSK